MANNIADQTAAQAQLSETCRRYGCTPNQHLIIAVRSDFSPEYFTHFPCAFAAVANNPAAQPPMPLVPLPFNTQRMRDFNPPAAPKTTTLSTQIKALMKPLDPTIAERRQIYAEKIKAMRLTLRPILPLHNPEAGPHPDLPKTVMEFSTLTEDQIDSIMLYYSQSSIDAFTTQYANPVIWDAEWLAKPAEELSPTWETTLYASPPEVVEKEAMLNQPGREIPEEEREDEDMEFEIVANSKGKLTKAVRLGVKRRLLGRFMGFGGCWTPTWERECRTAFVFNRIVERLERTRAQREADEKVYGRNGF